MSGLPVTRRVLARALVLNAAKRPLNVAVPGAVLVAGLVLAWWLIPVALMVYAAMVVATVLDGDVAERVGSDTYTRARGSKEIEPAVVDGPMGRRLELARAEEQRVRDAIRRAPLPLRDLDGEVDRLMEALERLARRATVVHDYLHEDDPAAIARRLARLRRAQTGDDAAADNETAQAIAALEEQLAARGQLERQLSRFDAQMEHIAATLGAIHAQVVRMSVEEEASEQGRVAGQVRDLRQEVAAAADAMQEAYRELG